MWSFETTTSAPSSAAIDSGLPKVTVATSSGKVAWVCGAESQVWVASTPRWSSPSYSARGLSEKWPRKAT
jgi:hypothetical protein